ncbi:RNase adapter RapZ [Pseudodesulfovibrio tunisiensis]|uniref:RNase adapter RapZ n=1 Tax=Pseudodesulfovibrio tunisiensis TaxID=463192 RepID=UPI001FB39396|nr:RNase adapter RapZ [Pseudodesulfovibrio tunisiensis]
MSPRNTFPVIVVTGISGSGKSTALRVFEDLGYFCIDGLPAGMVPKLAELFSGQDKKHRGLVLGMDLRQPDFPRRWEDVVSQLQEQQAAVQVVFLEARMDTLVRRYATTRRPHPLETRDLGLEQALERERDLLDPVRQTAALVIDTTGYSIHDLRRVIQEKWAAFDEEAKGMRVHVISFGFKYGVPREADLVFDLRFLPNPYFDEKLKQLSGKDAAVSKYVLQGQPGSEFLDRYLDFLEYILPLYAEEGRYRMTLALGCTGGRHRSVAVAEAVYARLKDKGYAASIEHRHLELG